jgi:hypothetical protein
MAFLPPKRISMIYVLMGGFDYLLESLAVNVFFELNLD